jgi:hypothetical protein
METGSTVNPANVVRETAVDLVDDDGVPVAIS